MQSYLKYRWNYSEKKNYNRKRGSYSRPQNNERIERRTVGNSHRSISPWLREMSHITTTVRRASSHLMIVYALADFSRGPGSGKRLEF
jgi:hypothetical protein